MKSFLVAATALLSLATTACGGEGGAPPIRAEVLLDREKILPGEPLRVLVCCELRQDIDHNILVFGVDNNPWREYSAEITVTDSQGEDVPSRMRPEALARLLNINTPISPGRKYLFPLELHRWCTTDLPPGRYAIHLDGLQLRYKGHSDNDQNGAVAGTGLISIPDKLFFTVLDPNYAQVQSYYKELLERVTKYSSLSMDDRRLAKFELNLFVHALSKAAAEYQLEFVLQGFNRTHYWEWWYEERCFNAFMSIPSLEIAQALDKYYAAHHKESGLSSTEIGVWHVMTAYASCRDPKIRDLAVDFLNRHPEAREVASRPILTYDGWTSDGIDSSVLEVAFGGDCTFPVR